jgi:hypothetical protein
VARLAILSQSVRQIAGLLTEGPGPTSRPGSLPAPRVACRCSPVGFDRQQSGGRYVHVTLRYIAWSHSRFLVCCYVQKVAKVCLKIVMLRKSDCLYNYILIKVLLC